MPADRLFHPKLGQSVKVNALDHFEFRVWVTYELAADDFGVMRLSAVTIQAASEALEKEDKGRVQSALEKLVELGLIEAFDHQGRRYCCQRTWQNEQRVKHPRDTIQPLPPAELIARCTPATQKLFEKHTSHKREADVRPLSGEREAITQPPDNGQPTANQRTSGEEESKLEPTPVNTRLTANGYRLTANGRSAPDVIASSPPFDVWFAEFQRTYPAKGRTTGPLAMQAFLTVFELDAKPPAEVWTQLQRAVQGYSRSGTVQAGKVKNMTEWLKAGHYAQEHDEPPAERRSNVPDSAASAARRREMFGNG